MCIVSKKCLTSCSQSLQNPPYSPTSALLRVLTPTQSAAQDENLDHAVIWQSSWHGSWQAWVRGGMGPASFKQAEMSTCPPSCFLQDTAWKSDKKWMRKNLAFSPDNYVDIILFTLESSLIYRHGIKLTRSCTSTCVVYCLLTSWIDPHVYGRVKCLQLDCLSSRVGICQDSITGNDA